MSETTTTTETVIVGRRDYGWGVEMQVVTIGGEQFLTRGGKVYRQCGDCDGLHSGTKMAYAGLHGGVCYRCEGRGVARKSFESVEAAEKAQAAKARREVRKAAAAEAETAALMAERDAWVAANPVAAERLAAVYAEVYAPFERFSDAAYQASEKGAAKYGDFVLLMANYASYKALTEAQTTAALDALDKAVARAAAAAEKAAGRRHLDVAEGAKVKATGMVVTAITVDGYYGAKRLVVIEGEGEYVGVTFKTFGTAESLWSTERGDHVEVTGAVKGFETYQGVPQTILTRTKVATLATA